MNRSSYPRTALLAAALGLCACYATPPAPLPVPEAGPTSVFAESGSSSISRRESAPVLYARDGSVVDSQGVGAAVGGRPIPARRDLTPGEGGRMYLLELYQNVIEERDGLAREVTSLQADLEQARAERGTAQAGEAALRQQLADIELSNATLLAENLDLAGRLTTAQIRRLQAEKLLLEHKIAAERAAREAASSSELAEVSQP